MASKSSRLSAQKNKVRVTKPRTAGGALSGLLGAVVMSVVAGVLVTVAVTPVVAVSGAAANTAISVFENLPNHLNPGQLAQPSTLYAKQNGKNVILASFFAQNRVMVKWENISQYAKDAAVAAEDSNFYSHAGVDVVGVGRAAIGQLVGKDAGGASTITMQYVRNVLVQQAESIVDDEAREKAYAEATDENFARKLQEMRFAISIEKKYSKDDILLGYLNIALFGNNIYGIEAASKAYYGKKAKDLTLSEAASLIAIVQYPSALNLSDEENIPANKIRRDYVLQRMLDTERITQEQFDEAVATEVVPKLTQRESGCDSAEEKYGLGHFCDYVQRYIESDSHFGATSEERQFNFLRGGYKIFTTVDLDLQKASLSALRGAVPKQLDNMNIGAATVSVKPGTGEILAMVQNRPFSADPEFLDDHPGYTSVNYNTDYEMGGSSGFQIGSTTKAFTVAEWLRSGHSLYDYVNANGRTVNSSQFRAACLGGVYGTDDWSFKNDSGQMPGNVNIMTGTANSLNGAFVSMQQQLDLCDTVQTAQDLGVHRASDLPVDDDGNPIVPTLHDDVRDLTIVPSTTFAGTDEIAPLTMATAYAAFVNDGKWCTPVPILSILDSDRVDVAFTKSKCTEGISADVAAGVVYALVGVLGATGAHAVSQFGIPHFLKTGTTNDNKDRWNVGGTTKLVTAVWTGNVSGFVNLDYSGLGRPDRSIFADIMYTGDQIYGGDAFPDPPSSATQRVTVAVPDVTGLSVAEAEQRLQDVGFATAQGGEVNSSVAQGLVARTDPSGEASRGVTITIYTSKGNMSAVPDGLVGQTGSAAQGTLSAAGFSNITMACGSGSSQGVKLDAAKHTVSSVSPGSGSDARQNTKITLSLKCV